MLNLAKGALTRMRVDDLENVWIAPCSPREIEGALLELASLPRTGRTKVVLCLPADTDGDLAARAIGRAETIADLVVVASDSIDATGTRVLVERDAIRAIVGAMQGLRRGDTFAVIGGPEAGGRPVAASIGLGASWRASWDEPEAGEFHLLPRAGAADLVREGGLR